VETSNHYSFLHEHLYIYIKNKIGSKLYVHNKQKEIQTICNKDPIRYIFLLKKVLQTCVKYHFLCKEKMVFLKTNKTNQKTNERWMDLNKSQLW
jgi:hypothetical protein